MPSSRSAVVVSVYRLGRRGVGLAQAQGDAAEGLHRAQAGVTCRAVTYLFSPDSVLLVSEFQGSIFDVSD